MLSRIAGAFAIKLARWFRRLARKNLRFCNASDSTEMVRRSIIRHGERRSFIIIDATGAVGTYTVAADCTGTFSVPNGPSFNMYVGPGAQKIWFTQIAGGAGSGPGLGVGTATRLPGR
jgi:hypothetical protein